MPERKRFFQLTSSLIVYMFFPGRSSLKQTLKQDVSIVNDSLSFRLHRCFSPSLSLNEGRHSNIKSILLGTAQISEKEGQSIQAGSRTWENAEGVDFVWEDVGGEVSSWSWDILFWKQVTLQLQVFQHARGKSSWHKPGEACLSTTHMCSISANPHVFQIQVQATRVRHST